MSVLRVRLAGADIAGPSAQTVMRRLLSEQHTDVRLGPRAAGQGRMWMEFRELTDDQIDGFVGLLRANGVKARYLEVFSDRSRTAG